MQSPRIVTNKLIFYELSITITRKEKEKRYNKYSRGYDALNINKWS